MIDIDKGIVIEIDFVEGIWLDKGDLVIVIVLVGLVNYIFDVFNGCVE